ncbi:MAG: hypothetical protein ABH971_00750 [bacterium]
MNLTKKQISILIGTVLGDGYLQKTGLKNARLRLEHGNAQKDYVVWKGKCFPKLFLGKPTYLERIHPQTKKTYSYWRWQSNSSPELGKWQKIFYQNGKKIIPKNLSDLLKEPLALAVWYMDDGYYSEVQRHSFLYLGKVMKEEAEISQKTIYKNFAVNGKVYDKKQKGYAIFFSVSETKKLHKIVKNYMLLPLFNYKISLTP